MESCLHVRVSKGGVSWQVEQVQNVISRMTVVDELEVDKNNIRRLIRDELNSKRQINYLKVRQKVKNWRIRKFKEPMEQNASWQNRKKTQCYRVIPNTKFKITKGGRSANRLRKAQIRKFTGFNNLLHLRTFRKCDTLRICNLRTGIPKKFADLGLQNESKNLRICDLQTQKVCLPTSEITNRVPKFLSI
jgi:hypothetical protein